MDNSEPQISDELKQHLMQIRKDCYGYKDYVPPSKKEVDKFSKALRTVMNGFEDRLMLPHIYELLEECGDYVPIEIFDSMPHMLETLLYAVEAKPPENRGRKRLELWKRMVTERLIHLYVNETKKEAKPYYKEDLATEPANEFTIWFHKIAQSLFPEMTDSNCKTLLEQQLLKNIKPLSF